MKLRVVFAIFLFSVLYFLFSGAAHAQFPSSLQASYLNTNPDVPQNFHTYTQSVFIEIAAAISCQLTGLDPTNPAGKCLGIDQKTGKIGFVEGGGGLIGITGSMIAMTFQIPVSSTHYGKYLADNFGITKKTYAANQPGGIQTGANSSQITSGIGFSGLKPLLAVWQAFRNMVYIFFVLIFIIIGLGIMFRIKIDPRTVMTIQNQIPKIIVGLILVTFSYAIAGLLIDLMYVSLYLAFNIFEPYVQGIDQFNPAAIQGSNPITTVGFLGGFKIVLESSKGLGGIIGSLFDGTYGNIIAGVVATLIGGGIGAAFGGPVGIGAGAAVGALGIGAGLFGLGGKVFGILGGLIAFIVIGVALLSALFRLWFQLIKAYIFILVDVVFAPFWIAAGLIPGSTLGFGPWLRDIAANLSAFPATLVMFLLGKIFIDAFGTVSTPDNFVPPFVGNPGSPSAFGAIIGLGIILLTPNVVNIVRQALKAPEAKFVATIGQSARSGMGITSMPERLGKLGMSWYYASRAPGFSGLLNRIGRLGRGGGGGGTQQH